MAIHVKYWNAFCPYCNTAYEGAVGFEGWCRLGFELLVCPNQKCARILRTHCTEWNHMTDQQQWGYRFSGIVVLSLSTYAFAMMMVYLTSHESGLFQDLIENSRWFAGFLIFLFSVKAIRIARSKARCPEGSETLTIAYQRWPMAPSIAFALLGVVSLVAFPFVQEIWQEWLYAGIVGSVGGLALCGKLRWHELRPEHAPPSFRAASTASSSATQAPPPENPWAR
jgi:hypothetical protein